MPLSWYFKAEREGVLPGPPYQTVEVCCFLHKYQINSWTFIYANSLFVGNVQTIYFRNHLNST